MFVDACITISDPMEPIYVTIRSGSTIFVTCYNPARRDHFMYAGYIRRIQFNECE